MTVAMHNDVKVLADVPKGLLIAGEWRPAAGGATFDVTDPATGEALCQVADASVADGLDALDSAAAAQASFLRPLPRGRGSGRRCSAALGSCWASARRSWPS
jgi:succinate-semialdehyde dehydrogenase/glutarate-semialdehyde dehydrogenase